MSQNGPFPGPPWPGKSSDDEPYAEPADPWREHAVAEPSWAANPPPPIPHQSAHQPAQQSAQQSASSFHSAPPSDPAPSWGPTATPPRRNTPIVALVVVLGLLIVAGLGATGWLLKDSWVFQGLRGTPTNSPQPSPSVTTTGSGTTQGSEDARFVTVGQCVVNQGTNDQPDMHKSVCTTGTYEVLKVVKGKSSGEKDAENKCSKVAGYTNWFYYDSDFDDLDVVLCLKKQ